jgi:uncharacterized membrane protein SpoIIM required for sporulation
VRSRGAQRYAGTVRASTARDWQNQGVTDERANDSRLVELAKLLDTARTRGVRALGDRDLLELVRLYRYAASQLALSVTRGRKDVHVRELEALTNRAHALLQRGVDARKAPLWRRLSAFFFAELPRAVRAEWKLILASFALIYGLALIAYVAVSRDLDVAWSLMNPAAVDMEIAQLQQSAAGEPFRGNFTFGMGESAGASGWIMAHNMFVAVLFFASALVPPLYVMLMSLNGLMIGTYTGVASHWDQSGSILSILVCHGTLEIQAFVLAGAAGLVLVRAWVAPGAWSRRHAMRVEASRAWRLLAPVFPILFFAGLIEGFVTPHVGSGMRITVAVLSGGAMVAWALLGGRGTSAEVAR